MALILIAGSAALAQEGVGAFAGFTDGVDARALGMGGAFVALADSYSATYWNPAGVALAGGPRVGGMYSNKFMADINFNFLSGITNIAGMSVAGTFMGLTVAGIPQYDENGNQIGTINDNELMFGGSVAMSIAGIGFAGATVKSYSHTLAGESGTGFGFDAGLLVIGAVPGISLGAAAFDIGDTTINWTTGAVDKVGSLFRLGAAYAMNGLMFAGEYDFGSYIDPIMRFGMEFNLDVVRVRGGAVMPAEGGELGFTAGAGLNLAPLYIDFAWVQNKLFPAGTKGVGDTLVLSAEFVF
ncbi:MAG: hypothetical protein GWN87_28790 [Desulfuromonadales bacterium]|nr:hypothetical protein [Desulfuromonadales bacterium]